MSKTSAASALYANSFTPYLWTASSSTPQCSPYPKPRGRDSSSDIGLERCAIGAFGGDCFTIERTLESKSPWDIQGIEVRRVRQKTGIVPMSRSMSLGGKASCKKFCEGGLYEQVSH